MRLQRSFLWVLTSVQYHLQWHWHLVLSCVSCSQVSVSKNFTFRSLFLSIMSSCHKCHRPDVFFFLNNEAIHRDVAWLLRNRSKHYAYQVSSLLMFISSNMISSIVDTCWHSRVIFSLQKNDFQGLWVVAHHKHHSQQLSLSLSLSISLQGGFVMSFLTATKVLIQPLRIFICVNIIWSI